MGNDTKVVEEEDSPKVVENSTENETNEATQNDEKSPNSDKNGNDESADNSAKKKPKRTFTFPKFKNPFKKNQKSSNELAVEEDKKVNENEETSKIEEKE